MNSTIPFKLNPLNKIIGLSIVLSMGFLLVVLAGIYGNWFPIVIGIIFAVAHIPIIVSNVLSEGYRDYDFNFDASSNSPNAGKEIGLFISAVLLMSGLSLPILLHHSHILTTTAMVLTIFGGGLIYGTVYTFSLFFRGEEEEELEDIGGGVI